MMSDAKDLSRSEVKAEALREAADAIGAAGPAGVAWWYTGWLRARAAKLEQQ